tara:strand:+ start:894 stop:1211 length:318 start_codon:yes stop_codon:yes gene_type:complete
VSARLLKILLLNIFIISSANANEMMKVGKDIFYGKSGCANCHAMNSSDGNVRKMYFDRVYEVVKNGYGVMPAYKDKLSDKEIKAVSAYISEKSKNWKNKLGSFVQ